MSSKLLAIQCSTVLLNFQTVRTIPLSACHPHRCGPALRAPGAQRQNHASLKNIFYQTSRSDDSLLRTTKVRKFAEQPCDPKTYKTKPIANSSQNASAKLKPLYFCTLALYVVLCTPKPHKIKPISKSSQNVSAELKPLHSYTLTLCTLYFVRRSLKRKAAWAFVLCAAKDLPHPGTRAISSIAGRAAYSSAAYR